MNNEKQITRGGIDVHRTRATRAITGIMAALTLVLLAGCAPTNVQQTSENTGALPRPDRILVYDFAVSPDEVKLDEGLSAEIKQRYDGEQYTNRTPEELKVGHTVAYVVADELVKKIQSYGLWAERAMGSPSRRGNTLIIKGQFLTIDEGNRAERVAIGFSAGRTNVQADVQVFELTARGRTTGGNIRCKRRERVQAGHGRDDGGRVVDPPPADLYARERRRGGGQRSQVRYRGGRRKAHGRQDRGGPGAVLREPGLDSAGRGEVAIPLLRIHP